MSEAKRRRLGLVASVSRYQPNAAERAFMIGRLGGFISPDVGRYSIEHLLMEAYMQGLRDADEVFSARAALSKPGAPQ